VAFAHCHLSLIKNNSDNNASPMASQFAAAVGNRSIIEATRAMPMSCWHSGAAARWQLLRGAEISGNIACLFPCPLKLAQISTHDCLLVYTIDFVARCGAELYSCYTRPDHTRSTNIRCYDRQWSRQLRLGNAKTNSVQCSRHTCNKKLSYRRETARQLPTWRGGAMLFPLEFRAEVNRQET